MENYKTLLIILILLFLSCSLFQSEEVFNDGWTYVKDKDYATALKKFRIDFKDNPDSLDIVCGLFYVHFVFQINDSTKYYLNKSIDIDPDNNKTLFVGGLYYREKDYDSCNYFYEKFVQKNSPLYDPYIFGTTIKTNSFHKIGLSSQYYKENYQFVYDVLKTITDISDSLDLSLTENKLILFDYIKNLEE